MFFLKNRATQSKDETTSSQSSFEPIKIETSVPFVPRFFRNSEPFSGPDYLYENEAWAPEEPQVRLFNKKWGITEDNSSQPSDTQ